MTQPLLQANDLRGAAQLTTDAVAALASLVEAMHARVASVPWRDAAGADSTRGITGLVYETVRGVTRLAGGSAEALLAWLAPALATAEPHQVPSAEREAVLAALNGVLGDHLAATGNPLAIDMAFRVAGKRLPIDRFGLRTRLVDATPRLLVLIHGLCMNDLQWRRDGHDHGEALAQELGFTPVYLHYNSGLSVSTNGRILAALMERLYDVWPMPVERLVIVGHSMGGLVARSAIHHGALLQRGNLRWPARVDDLVCLGTPHQGAPLERAGHGLELLLAAAPYAAPLAKLARVRSAGIRDLRLGNVLGATREGGGDQPADQVGLPGRTRCHAVAGHLGPQAGDLKSRLAGDGLVPVASALGEHTDPARRLAFEADRQATFAQTGHLDLLCSPQVYGTLRQWLA
jgi:pimeloyl-ACP methyl ester carboxylesterase